VAVLQVHGTVDGNVPYDGTTSPPCDGCSAFPSAAQSIATWAELNGCDAALVDSGVRLDLDGAVPGAETRLDGHVCAQGAAELWSMVGSAHKPSLAQPSTTERFFDWLLAHPKP
jgi:poly(3-hydroxybutyrate) depolymerase